MLTEAEKEWLETRLQNLKASGWFSCAEGELIPLVNFHRKHLNPDWKDCAEFEARVAAKLAGDVESYFEIIDGVRIPIRWAENVFLRLKHARLAVEEEMEKE